MKRPSSVSRGVEFARVYWIGVVLISLGVLVPCFWQRHIEAGDLGSHAYNAWLAQLIGQGRAPGLYLARQWHNVLFDFVLLGVARVAGFLVAEKVAVALAVLILFWGAFALVAALSERAPWLLTPGLAMLAYGYSFNMGFFNYYMSVGLACWSVAIFLGGCRADRLKGVAVLPLIYLAHPIGFLLAVGVMGYFMARWRLAGLWRFAVPVTAVVGVLLLHWMLATRTDYDIDWTKDGPFYVFNGSDQLVLYGDHYASLARFAVLFGVICFVADLLLRRRDGSSRREILLPLELYLVSFAVIALLPENIRSSPEVAWSGLLVSRLTLVAAIFGLAIMGSLRPRKWHLAGFSLIAVTFFIFLHDDAVYLNQVEANADALLSPLPYGTRVIPTLSAAPDSRIEFVGHLADRACIGHCFTFSNYEPASGQFRVRATPGNRIAVSPYPQLEKIVSAGYAFQAGDLPLVQLYECDREDLRKLCVREIQVGETARVGGPVGNGGVVR